MFPFVYMVNHLFITVTLGLAFVWITFRLGLCLGGHTHCLYFRPEVIVKFMGRVDGHCVAL